MNLLWKSKSSMFSGIIHNVAIKSIIPWTHGHNIYAWGLLDSKNHFGNTIIRALWNSSINSKCLFKILFSIFHTQHSASKFVHFKSHLINFFWFPILIIVSNSNFLFPYSIHMHYIHFLSLHYIDYLKLLKL